MLTTIIFRYLGTILQFIVLSVIARSVSADDYGLYMLCLSIVFSGYYFVGLGASEAAVALLSHDLAVGQSEDVGQIVGTVLVLSLACVAVLLMVSVLALFFQPISGAKNNALVFVLFFLAANGVVFNVSQLLLGLGQSSSGSFFFYPAINLTLLFSTIPVALIFSDVTFVKLTIASSIGSALAAVGAVSTCLKGSDKFSLSWSFAVAISLIRSGIGLTGVRILHVVSFWIPTMVVGFMLSSASAGLIGTAGRLAIAISAVIAAIRFIVRPSIAKALAHRDMDYVRKLAGSIAFVTTSLGILAIVANELVGEYLIGLFFGGDMVAVAPILTVLLISVCAEGVFGPVDELLKLSGGQKIVAWVYGVGVLLFLVGSSLLAYIGLIWIAWLQVFYVLGIFCAMNLAVYRKFEFLILPTWPDIKMLRSVR